MNVFLKKEYPVKWIPVGDTSVVMPSAQRALKTSKVEAIIKDFDPNAFGTGVVCKPNGREHYHIIDGQHRAEALRRMYGDAERMPCIVIPANSVAEAAEAWLKINSSRTAPQALDRFNVGVVAGRPAEVEVHSILTDLGYRVCWDGDDGSFSAVGAALQIHRLYGPENLRATLEVSQATWGKIRDGAQGSIIKGVAEVLHKHAGAVDRDLLARKVSKKFTPARLLGAAKAGREMFKGTIGSNIARILVQTYNTGLRTNRLEEA